MFGYHDNRVSACSVNSKDNKMLSGSWDKDIIFWDLETCKPLVSLNMIIIILVTLLHMISGKGSTAPWLLAVT